MEARKCDRCGTFYDKSQNTCHMMVLVDGVDYIHEIYSFDSKKVHKLQLCQDCWDDAKRWVKTVIKPE